MSTSRSAGDERHQPADGVVDHARRGMTRPMLVAREIEIHQIFRDHRHRGIAIAVARRG
jgi:hypothetical protein